MLDLDDEGDMEAADGWCVYCKRTTTWLITVLDAPNRLRFECTRCCKISRDVTLSDPPLAEEATHDPAPPRDH